MGLRIDVSLRRRFIIVACLLTIARPAVALADETGYLGLAIEVDGEGFFLNPTLKSVKVTAVTPSSPAALAGIATGDLIIEAESRVVAGAKARDLEPLLKKRVGESLHLRMKRPGGETYDATVVASVRPVKP
jgi:C-terminal processing protease CtpA/Prc